MAVEWEIVKEILVNLPRLYKIITQNRELVGKNKELSEKNKELQEKIEGLDRELQLSQDNYRALENRPNTPNAEFIGWYNDENGLMPQITLFLKELLARSQKQAEERGPAPTITIALDFAAYGAITWNKQFQQQEAIIRDLCELGDVRANPVKMIVNSSRTNREILESQYSPKSWAKDQAERMTKISEWVRSDLFKVLASKDQQIAELKPNKSLEQITNAVQNGKAISRELFIKAFLRFNERLIERYEAAKGDVTPRKTLVPLHGWLWGGQGIDTEGIIGIVDVKAVWNEPGFRVRDEVAQRIKQLIDLFA